MKLDKNPARAFRQIAVDAGLNIDAQAVDQWEKYCDENALECQVYPVRSTVSEMVSAMAAGGNAIIWFRDGLASPQFPNKPYADAKTVFEYGHIAIREFKERYGETYRETVRRALDFMHRVHQNKKMRFVIIESPYAGDTKRNLKYAHMAVRDCIRRGETPYASHIMLTRALDDTVPEQRDAGITAGLSVGALADAIVVYQDLGISSGMIKAINHYAALGIPIEHRNILKKEQRQ